MLKLHKVLLDAEREMYEGIHGPRTPTEFLSLLLEDEDFAWLRNFSRLIVDIDEMFAQRDGFTDEAVGLHLERISRLIAMEDAEDEYFIAKYQFALQRDPEAAGLHSELHALIDGLGSDNV